MKPVLHNSTKIAGAKLIQASPFLLAEVIIEKVLRNLRKKKDQADVMLHFMFGLF